MESALNNREGMSRSRARKNRISFSFPFLRVFSRRRGVAGESGQALVLAIVIMLLLVFLGTLFLKGVLSNLRHAEHSQAASNEYTAAEAGIKFADTNLTTSELGADWRPRPSYNVARLQGTGFLTQDPDYPWIQPFKPGKLDDPTDDVGGYIRYNLGDARFLLRVTYNPENVATAPVMPDVDPSKFDGTKFGPTPLSRFVMIEAVGRRGSAAEIDQEYQDYIANGDPIDPTVFAKGSVASAGSPTARFRRELIAFKAIGINNYLRFVTDRDRLNQTTYFGVDQALMRDGNGAGVAVDYPYRLGMDADAFSGKGDNKTPASGSPIRVNGDLVWYGSDTAAVSGSGPLPEVTLSLTKDPWDVVEVAGEIRREGKGEDTADSKRMALKMYPQPSGSQLASSATVALPASSDTEFAQMLSDPDFSNRYLDNKWLVADPTTKQTVDPRRSIRRLEPPQLEIPDPASGMLRYEVMTRNAGAVQLSSGNEWRARAAARYGFGEGIYIDNARHNGDHTSCRGDIQYNHDADRLRNEWLRPYAQIDQSGGKTGWVYPGRVYSPPGVVITIEPDWSNPNAPDTHGLIRITRSDFRGWRGPDGSTLPVQTMFFELQPGPAPAAGNSQEYTLLPKYWDSGTWHTWDWDNWKWIDMPASVPAKWRYPFNGILYAEGNVRFRGALPRDTVDGGVRLAVVSRGSIYIEGNVAKGLPADANSPERSEIALMARDYVTLNTTQFLQVQTDFNYVAGGDNGPPYYWRLPVNEPEHSFNVAWDFGLSPDPNQANEVTNYYKSNAVAVFLRHEAARGPATLQWLVNNTPYLHILGAPYTSTQDFYPLRNAGAWEYFSDASLKDFPLWDPNTSGGTPPNQDSTQYSLYTGVGQRNTIRITGYDPGTAPDGSNVTGGDYNLANVAIQPLDIVIKAMIYAEHQSWFVIPGAFYQDTSAGDPEPPSAERYPKNQEPLDVQIHVIGAIAEGKAASLQDATQWTAHWRGANRTAYEAASGDSDEDWSFSRRGGINYIFDPSLITNTRSIRYSADEPAYYLPAVPRLPMCPDLVYCGERPVQ